MSEVTFAKQFLATIDKRPIKLPADHVSDPRKYPTQSPYILPRQTHPFPRRTGPTSTHRAATSTLTITLKPMRSGAGDPLTLPNITLDTTIHDLKTQYAAQTGLAQEKIKLLYNKKPTQDLKTLKDVGVAGDAELSVMVMGGGSGGTPRMQSPAPTPPVVEKEVAPVVPDAMDVDEKSPPGPESEKATAEAVKGVEESTAGEILKGEEFWDDLKGFLSQRLRDEKEGEKLVGVFRSAWKST